MGNYLRTTSFLLFSLFWLGSAFGQNLESPDYLEITEEFVSNSPGYFQNNITQTLGAFEVLGKIKDQFVSLLFWRPLHESLPEDVERYVRKKHFGRWINDPNDNTCFDTRSQVLERDSKAPVQTSPSNRCRVEKGLWVDPYTGQETQEARQIQIDHVVPLKNAYSSGAYRWEPRMRCLYANFMGNQFHLLSVNARENMSKGDRAPDRYLPPKKEYQCRYVQTWLAIKLIWGLTMTPSEGQAIENTIRSLKCSLQDFKISLNNLEAQRKIIQDNADLCVSN